MCYHIYLPPNLFTFLSLCNFFKLLFFYLDLITASLATPPSQFSFWILVLINSLSLWLSLSIVAATSSLNVARSWQCCCLVSGSLLSFHAAEVMFLFVILTTLIMFWNFDCILLSFLIILCLFPYLFLPLFKIQFVTINFHYCFLGRRHCSILAPSPFWSASSTLSSKLSLLGLLLNGFTGKLKWK